MFFEKCHAYAFDLEKFPAIMPNTVTFTVSYADRPNRGFPLPSAMFGHDTEREVPLFSLRVHFFSFCGFFLDFLG